jgi:hypothetical protein
MRAVGLGRFRASAVHGTWTIACVLGSLAPACRSAFTGPYDCNPGYASCVSPEQNLCETNTLNDALHCGALPVGESCADSGSVTECALGASCVDGGCGGGATQLATFTTTSPSNIVVNASGVFWSDMNNVYWLPASGGAPMTVSTNLFSCGQAAAFAVDSTSVYYFSSGFNCGNMSCSGLVQSPLSGVPQGGSPTLLVPAPSGGNNNLCASSIELSSDGAELYWLAGNQNGGGTSMLTLGKVAVSGGTPSTVGTVASPNGAGPGRLVVTPTAAIFTVEQTNAPQAFEIFPTSGGSATVLTLPPNYSSFSQFTADSDSIYTVGSGCPCDNNGSGGNYGGPPTGWVGKIPLDGTAATVLTPFDGEAGDVAVDPGGGYVYWSTDTAAWKVPVTGGSSVAVAGNLTGGVPEMLCSGCGSGYNAPPIAIGIDTSHVYLADHATNVNALLEVPK